MVAQLYMHNALVKQADAFRLFLDDLLCVIFGDDYGM